MAVVRLCCGPAAAITLFFECNSGSAAIFQGATPYLMLKNARNPNFVNFLRNERVMRSFCGQSLAKKRIWLICGFNNENFVADGFSANAIPRNLSRGKSY